MRWKKKVFPLTFAFMKSYFEYLTYDVRLSTPHQKAEKGYEKRMGEYAKSGRIKEFENEIKRYERFEANSEKRASKKYDRMLLKQERKEAKAYNRENW
ncbi:MAG: hypothetical protein WC495_06760 [Patescibacteria group bacterium]